MARKRFTHQKEFAHNLADIRRSVHELGRELPTDFQACFYLDINVNDDEEEAFEECKQFLDGYYEHDFSHAEVEMHTIRSVLRVITGALEKRDPTELPTAAE